MLTINEILDLIQTGKINESNLESKDLIRIQFYTQKLNEEVYKNYITAFHRTKDIKEFLTKSNKYGFQLGGGKGAMYGVGLYGNYTWEGVHSQYSMNTYGDYVVKYIVKPNNILFFDEKTQIKIYGKPMSIVEQCDYWGIKLTNIQRKDIKQFDNKYEKITSENALRIVNNVLFQDDNMEELLIPDVFGISYNGNNDQDTILMYDFRNITIVGYYDETEGIAYKEDVIPLSKTHNYYNSNNVSKELYKNMFNIQSDTDDTKYVIKNDKVKDVKKLDITQKSISKMSQSYKAQLFNNMMKTLSFEEQVKYFGLIFFGDSDYFMITPKGTITRKDKKATHLIIDKLSLDRIPFQIESKKSNFHIKKSDIKTLDNIPTSIPYVFSLADLPNITSLDNLQKLKFNDKELEKHYEIQLFGLPLLSSLDYLPSKQSYSLRVQKCPNLDFNKIEFPPLIQKIVFTDGNKNLSDFNLSVLSKYENLSFVMINDTECKKSGGSWQFVR